MEIALRQQDGKVAFAVKARAGGRRNAVTGVHAGALKVEVTVAPEKGRANQAILRLLSATLGVKRGDLVLLAGEASPRKTVGVSGLAREIVRERLTQALENAK